MELEQHRRTGAIAARPGGAGTGEQTDPASGARRGFYVYYGKRLLDLAVAGVVLVAGAPLLAVIAVAIKLDSPGPVIFAQERVGKNGARFTMFKFRTMRTANDSAIHREHVTRLIAENTTPPAGTSLKLQHDPRVTRVGRWLRRTSLDELPQFANVLRGDMSVVGPRPDVPYAVAAYPLWYHARFRAAPGITGLWQVEARNRVSYEAMIRLDIAYYDRQSLHTDLMLILKTPLAMLRGEGAG